MAYLIALIILAIPSYLIRFSVFGIPSTVLEILIYLVFLYGLSQARKFGFRKIPWKVWVPVVLLLVAVGISTAVSPLKHEALGELKAFFIDPILVAWLIWQFVKREDIEKIALGLAGAGLIVSVHAIAQKILGNVTPDNRVIGIFGYSPNYLSLFLAPLAVLAAAYSFRLQDKRPHLVKSVFPEVLFIIFLYGIYLSGSRGGLLAVAAGLTVFVVFRFWGWIRERISSQVIIAILIILGIYTAWTSFAPNFSVGPTEGGRTATSSNVRWQIWQTSIEMIKDHPIFGIGLGNYQNAFKDLTKNRPNFPEYIAPVALTSHNVFLMFYLTTGLLGLVAFLWLVVYFLIAIVRKNSAFSPALAAAMVAILAYGLVDTTYFKNDLSLEFWVIWGLAWII